MKWNKIRSLALLTMLVCPLAAVSQTGVVVDQVIAVVGNSAILKSDILNQRRQLQGQGVEIGDTPECMIMDDMLFQKLLFNQAIIDSVIVSDEQVEQVLDRRLRFFIQQIGSRERLEAYYGKSIDEIKDEFREVIREQEMARMMESQITQNLRVTPSEVRSFFNRIPQDSIPLIETEIILAQIVKTPPVSQQEKDNVKSQLEEYRQRIIRGTSFATLAILYSEDPGSARRGGELGFFGRGELYPEFEAAAFTLRPGELSEIVETQAGFHIIQMIERRGEQFNVRHLLLRPEVSPIELNAARQQLDSIRNVIEQGQMTFEEAALQFSDDPGRINQGLMVNPVTGTNRFRPEDIDPNLFFVVDRMSVGEVSAPVGFTNEEDQQAFRLVKLVQRTEPRVANIQQDYDFIQQLALQEKRRRAILSWVKTRLPNTFVFIHESFRHCDYELDWLRNR
ncbi:MAG TPA: peptidylprolyl isomerase [Bacteroidales bacterium]|nr:peptidylprolyl isomerase [Bacteroidales bacterium]